VRALYILYRQRTDRHGNDIGVLKSLVTARTAN